MGDFNLFSVIDQNKEWLFSGAGIAFITLIYHLLKKKEIVASSNVEKIVQNFSINSNHGHQEGVDINDDGDADLGSRKELTRILFVDDDSRFKVVKILQKSGWRHTKTVKDIKTLDDMDVVWADIFFIDVQGVGAALGFSDEGLGLALAIKEKYPNKKVVIYSAETKGDRFHAALRKADSFLSKNADPYEFQKIVEDLSGVRK